MTGRLLYLGCYTRGAGGEGAGIMAGRADPDTGAVTGVGLAAAVPAPSFLARHPRLSVLYAVSELPQGRVSAWHAGPDGTLRHLAGAATHGAYPCHLAVIGGHLVVANYGSGSLSVHPIGPDGAPGEAVDVVTHTGRGPDPHRQEAAHAHSVAGWPDGRGLFALDLGADAIIGYTLDEATGRLGQVSLAHARPGAGPRHLARPPAPAEALYVAGELDATVTSYAPDPGHTGGPGRPGDPGRDGSTRPESRGGNAGPESRGGRPGLERNGGLPEPAAATGAGVPATAAPRAGLRELGRVAVPGGGLLSEIATSPDGRFLYVASRGPDTIVTFRLSGGLPVAVGAVGTRGAWPRHFSLVNGFIQVANERSHTVVTLRPDPRTGLPAPTGAVWSVPSPTCVLAFES